MCVADTDTMIFFFLVVRPHNKSTRPKAEYIPFILLFAQHGVFHTDFLRP